MHAQGGHLPLSADSPGVTPANPARFEGYKPEAKRKAIGKKTKIAWRFDRYFVHSSTQANIANYT